MKSRIKKTEFEINKLQQEAKNFFEIGGEYKVLNVLYDNSVRDVN